MTGALTGNPVDIASAAGAFILILFAVVLVHELGHYAAGRWCRIAVASFALGFGRELAGFTDRRGVRWKLCAIPLGGVVRFSEAPIGAMSGFSASPLWRRAVVVAAGPLANFVFAFLLYLALFLAVGDREREARIGSVMAKSPASAAGLARGDLITHVDGTAIPTYGAATRALSCDGPHRVTVSRQGVTRDVALTPELKSRAGGVAQCETGIGTDAPAIIGRVLPGLPADKAGLQPGDRIVGAGGRPISSYEDLVAVIVPSAETPLPLTVLRNGAEIALTVTPMTIEDRDWEDKPYKRGRIGVSAQRPAGRPLGVGEAVSAAAHETGVALSAMATAAWKLVTARQKEAEVAGPIAMAEVTADVIQAGFETVVMWMALLSANLGVFNLLPIPVLDGGHLVLFGIEGLRGRPLGARVQAIGFRFGLAAILALMAYVNLVDILRIGKRFF
jgi:regulator of sigma E protease